MMFCLPIPTLIYLWEIYIHISRIPIPTLIYLWEIYLFPGSLCLFCYGKICGPILRLYKSLTDTRMWKLGLRPRNSQKRNASRGFLLQCKPHRPDFTLVTREKFTSVTVITSLRDLDHDGRWSTYDENVRKLPEVGFLPGGHKSTPDKHKRMLFLPASSSPLITEDLHGWHVLQMVFTFNNRFISSGVRLSCTGRL